METFTALFDWHYSAALMAAAWIIRGLWPKLNVKIVIAFLGVFLAFAWVCFIYKDCVNECIARLVVSWFCAIGFHTVFFNWLEKEIKLFGKGKDKC
jgi:hypothetical protein